MRRGAVETGRDVGLDATETGGEWGRMGTGTKPGAITMGARSNFEKYIHLNTDLFCVVKQQRQRRLAVM